MKGRGRKMDNKTGMIDGRRKGNRKIKEKLRNKNNVDDFKKYGR